MSDAEESRRAWAENPFFVLGLPPDAPRAEVERTGQKLLGELALGRAAASTYETPFGPRARTPDLVRSALSELRDPRKRLLHELRAKMPVGAPPSPPSGTLPGLFAALGWRSR